MPPKLCASIIRRSLAVSARSRFFFNGGCLTVPPEEFSVRPEAVELIKHVQSMEFHAAAVQEEMGRTTQGQASPVRIATMEGIASCYLAPRINQIAASDPKLKIELFSNPHIVDLLRKETDLFISFFNPKIAGLISKKIGECAIYIYGSKNYEKQYGMPKTRDELRNHYFVSYITEMVTIESVRWLEEIVPKPNIVFASNSIISQTNAATSGVGLVVLPTFVGDQTRALFRVLSDEVVIFRPIWLSVTRDQSELPSIRSAAATITELFSADRSHLMGDDWRTCELVKRETKHAPDESGARSLRQMLRRNVYFGSKANKTLSHYDVHFTPESGHQSVSLVCPLCAKSGHRTGPTRHPCAEQFQKIYSALLLRPDWLRLRRGGWPCAAFRSSSFVGCVSGVPPNTIFFLSRGTSMFLGTLFDTPVRSAGAAGVFGECAWSGEEQN